MRSVLGPSIKLAIFTVVTVLFTGVLAATIANTGFGRGSGYTAIFTDASGLQQGDDVRMRGVKIGQVTSLRIQDNQYAAVDFQVESSRVLPALVTATIKYRNLIGQRYISLDTGTPAAGQTSTLPVGGTIPLARTRPALNLTELFNGFHPLFQALSPDEVNKLSYEIIQVFQGEGPTVESLLASTASLTNTLADRDEVIGRVIDNLNTVIGTVSARAPELSQLISTLQQLVSGLNEQRRPIGSAVDAIGELTKSTAGLVEDARPPLRSDIDQLRQLAGTLNDNAPTIDRAITNWGPKLDKLVRSVSYGSWFNFYMCQIEGQVSVNSTGVVIPVYPFPLTERPRRCGP
ncbi:MAG TPA: MCE family protein [Pseudonocardia sp.]|jgi:phospholipid/cholesterol/gamma-HCH transport system substrate-binding protein|uniref:MCE family protein n=1 Tax=Pseudonocardia sp. TaxID=60912 RepID=UPI002B9080D0|nr:MCE family protein [Pseudonocardia sp.]HTF49626.1 MCE family protein [Pseudonocardia sp.]